MTLNFGIGQSELPWGDAFTATGADVTRICQEIASLGANSIRISTLWIQLDPNRNGKTTGQGWDNLDRAVVAAEAAGLDILLIVEPRRSLLPVGVAATPSMAAGYGRLCGNIAKKYPGRIRWYEIGNEVNNFAFFGGAKTPSKYLDFLRQAFTNITANDPAAEVLAGALQAVATGWPTMHPVEWVTDFYNANPQEYFHGLSMHPYSTDGVFNPLAPTPDNEFAFKNLDAIRAIMDANDDAEKFIYTTEWGYDSMRTLNGLSETNAELEAEQAVNIQTHWNILESYADMGVIYPTTWIFMYRDWEQPLKKPQLHFGFNRFDYTRKPSWFTVRSFAVDRDVASPTVESTAEAWAPELTVYVDPSLLKPPTATAMAQAWSPDIISPVLAQPAEASAEALAPIIESFRSVEFVSAGAGDRDTTDSDDITLTWSHVVTGVSGRVLLVGLVASTDTVKPWYLYDSLTVASDLGGSFVRLGSRHIADSTFGRGSVHIFGLYYPAVGTHNITAHVEINDGGVSSFASVAGDSILYRGAAGFGPIIAEGSSSGGNAPSITIPSVVDNRAFCVFGGAISQATGFNQTSRYTAGSTVDGDGDFMLIGDAPGALSVNFHSSGLSRNGLLALDLRRITTEMSVSPSTVTASAQAYVPVIQTSGAVNSPTATGTAQGYVPTVFKLIAPPVATASAQAFEPVVTPAGGDNVSSPTATATANADTPAVVATVAFDAVGAGSRVTGSANNISTNWSHTVGTGSNRYLLVGFVTSNTAISWTGFDTLSATSSVDGALTRLVSTDIGTQQLGSVHLFGIANPTSGAHTITISVVNSGDTFHSIMGDSLSYKNVASTSNSNTQNSFSGALNLTVTSAFGNYTVLAFGCGGSPSGFTQNSRYSAGGSVTGVGDFMILGDAVGAASVNYAAAASSQMGAVGIDLDHL